MAKIFPTIEFEESDPELDHAGDIDYLGKVGDKAFGIQIKPITANANFANYNITDRMSASFRDFEEKYGGKVFVVFSSKTGSRKDIVNKEIVATKLVSLSVFDEKYPTPHILTVRTNVGENEKCGE